MKTHTSALLALALLLSATAARSAPPADVARQLAAYYEDLKKAPPWEAALKRFDSDNVEERSEAAVYLRDLLAQALKDEQSGAAPWQATPFWGESARNPARELRRQVVRQFVERKQLPLECLPLVRWVLESEKLADLQALVGRVAGHISGKDADALLRELIAGPHPNAVVTAEALKAAAERKLDIKAETLTALCQHHRKAVRDAARAANAALDRPEPPPFDPAHAVRSDAVAALVERLGRLILDPAPVDATFVAVSVTRYEKGGKKGEGVIRGWLLREEKGRCELLTPFGRRETLTLSDKPISDDDGWDVTRVLVRVKAEDEVARVKAIREKDDQDFQLSERGGLTGQFRGRGMGLYEILMGCWLYTAKRYDLAAEVLLPALDTLYLDEHAVEIARNNIGELHGEQMLVAFVGDRDYDLTMKLAKRLAEHYPGTRFHEYAVGLAEQLPKRGDDFKGLKLPTAEEWAELKKMMTREQQFDYLCKRLRLLNCFQRSQPGGVSFSQTQYAEPCGLAANASWGLNHGKTEVINPLVELAGPVDGFLRRGDKRPRGLELTTADIELLAPYLREDWFVLAVSFWRDFHPNRNLHGTRSLVANLINHLARQELCNAEKLGKMTAAEREKELERIIRFARENAGKSEAELLLAALEAALKTEKRWYDIDDQAERLAELKEKKAVPLMVRFLDARNTTDLNLPDILRYCRLLDPDAAKDTAQKYLNHREAGARVQAALIVLQTGDKSTARKILGDVLAKENQYTLFDYMLKEAVVALIEDASMESRKEVLRIFSNPELPLINEHVRPGIVAACVKAGFAEGYRFYLRMVSLPGNRIGKTGFAKPNAERFTDEIIERFAPDDPEIERIARSGAKGEERTAAVKAWLEKKLAAMEKK